MMVPINQQAIRAVIRPQAASPTVVALPRETLPRPIGGVFCIRTGRVRVREGFGV